MITAICNGLNFLDFMVALEGSPPSGTRNISFNPSHAAIKISINATAAEFICKNIFPTPVQIKKIIKNKIGDIQQIYLYQNVC